MAVTTAVSVRPEHVGDVAREPRGVHEGQVELIAFTLLQRPHVQALIENAFQGALLDAVEGQGAAATCLQPLGAEALAQSQGALGGPQAVCDAVPQ